MIFIFQEISKRVYRKVVFDVREKYLLRDQFKTDEILKSAIEMEENGQYKELVEFIDNILEKKNYNTTDGYTETGLVLMRAKALLNTGRDGEAIGILEDIADKGGLGSKEAAYVLLRYYKDKGIDKYRELYNKKIFLRTNGVLQRIAVSMFPDLESGHVPEITNLKITPLKICLDVEDKDDDLKEVAVKLWYVENGQKLHFVDYHANDPWYFMHNHYVARYYAYYSDPAGAVSNNSLGNRKLFYRVYVKDWEGNTVDTGEKEVEASEGYSGYPGEANAHWASKYAELLSDLEEVPCKITHGDKYITNKGLFSMLVKYSYLSPYEKYRQKDIFTDFLMEERFVSRAEAVTFIIRFLNGVQGLKMGISEMDEDMYGRKFTDWGDVPAEYKDSMLCAIRIGAVIGYPDNTLKPANFITINEAAAVLARIKYGETARKEEYDKNKNNADGDTRDIRSICTNIVLNDEEAYKWYIDHSGDKYVVYEDGQWYLIEDNKVHAPGSSEEKIYKQKCSEELAVKVKNSMPEIYCEEKDGKIEIHILQKLGSPPHRYVLIVDKNTLEITGREIRDY